MGDIKYRFIRVDWPRYHCTSYDIDRSSEDLNRNLKPGEELEDDCGVVSGGFRKRRVMERQQIVRPEREGSVAHARAVAEPDRPTTPNIQRKHW